MHKNFEQKLPWPFNQRILHRIEFSNFQIPYATSIPTIFQYKNHIQALFSVLRNGKNIHYVQQLTQGMETP